MRNRYFPALLSVLLLLLPFGANAALQVAKTAMYGSDKFQQERYSFTPDDTFYIVVDFQDMEAGEYTLVTDWLTPMGTLEKQTSYTFTLDKNEPKYRFFSWLKLLRNGPLKKTFTGQDFKTKYYGIWEVQIYLNGNPVAKQRFKVL